MSYNGVKVNLGTAFSPQNVTEMPKLDWHVEDPKLFYSLIMVGKL